MRLMKTHKSLFPFYDISKKVWAQDCVRCRCIHTNFSVEAWNDLENSIQQSCGSFQFFLKSYISQHTGLLILRERVWWLKSGLLPGSQEFPDRRKSVCLFFSVYAWVSLQHSQDIFHLPLNTTCNPTGVNQPREEKCVLSASTNRKGAAHF